MEILVAPFRKYAVFTGRSGRKEFWVFFLFCILVGTLLTKTVDAILEKMLGINLGLANFLFSIFILVPWVAVSIRRLHDANYSGWWLLLGLIPIFGLIASLIMLALPGTKGENKYEAQPTD